MVTENTRNDVWQNFLDISRLVLYYDALFKRYQRCRYTIRFFQILPLLSAVTLIFSEFPYWVQALIGLLIAIAVGIDVIFDFTTKAIVIHNISLECSRLENEWSELWNLANSDHAEDGEVLLNNSRLANKLTDITGRAGEHGITESKRLNINCTKNAFKIMEMKYVHPAANSQ